MEERLEAYEMWIYRRIGKVSWTERKTNEYVLRMLGIKKQLLNIVKERKLKYYGHIKRHQTVQRITLEGKVEGKRSRGKQRLKWEDNIKGWTKRSMEECGRLAKDRVCLLILTVISAAVIYAILNEEDVPIPKHVDKWWGEGQPKDESQEKPRPFKVNVPQKDLDDLNLRLKNSRFSPSLEGINFEYGTNHRYLKEFVQYWSTTYDWRKQEQWINKYPQFLVKISGIDVHYIHIKPNSKRKVVPILISHGWPGSVVEFLNAISILEKSHPDFNFEIICPHIPGYGFSEAPKKTGFNYAEAAHVYAKLMQKLGHSKYYVQGGDWGGITVSALSALYPERVLGLHLNMAPHLFTTSNMVRYVLGSVIPSIAPAAEIGSPKIYPISEYISKVIGGSGYFHLQATLPASLGAALTDTPAGLASYILEKFAYGTNMEEAGKQYDGGLSKLDKDELITNLMVYWITNSISPSITFYKEAMSPALRKQKIDREPLLGMTALGWQRYKNITFWEKSATCGHFAAMEDPHGFARSIVKFVSQIEK
ncbi:Juvenile hormone epoxide hydrolase 2 [Nymphon striatum]|nr:Juvenile hormone epoxide hydrolase 2 [Nymphon striatum]